MANRRMLAKSISTSLQVNKLGIEAQLLFTWMIPHADDDGRLNGEAEYINFLVVPAKRWTKSQTESYLRTIHDAGLIHLWEENGTKYIEFPNWTKHQQIRKDRYSPSSIPPYHKELVNQSTTNAQPVLSQPTTQLSEIENNKNEVKSEKRNTGEREYEGKPPSHYNLAEKWKEVLATKKGGEQHEK